MRILTLLFLLVFAIQANAQEEWTEVENLPASARHHPITFSYGGYGYLVTGATQSIYTSDFYRYDPVADEWTQLPNFPGSARGFAYGVTYNDKAYIGFGVGGNSYLGDLWEYDFATEMWTQLATCPCSGRAHPAFVAAQGRIFMGLGNDFTGDLDDFWSYDIATNQWTQMPDFPGVRRHHPFYFDINDQVYVGFGHHTSTIFDDFYRFDPAVDEWTQMNDFPGEGRVAGTQFSYDGKGYVLSGQGEDHQNLDTGEFWEYDPLTDSWVELDPHPGTGRWAPGSFMIDNEVYIMCGEGNNLLNDMWRYTFELPVSVFEPEQNYADLTIQPNPAKTHLDLQLNDLTETLLQVQIFDMQGRQVEAIPGNNTTINISNLPMGHYALIAQFASGQSGRVLFQKVD